MDKSQKDKLDKIEKQRDKITNLLRGEFNDKEIGKIWIAINELINMEIEIEQECNK